MRILDTLKKYIYTIALFSNILLFAQEKSWTDGLKLSGSADVFYKADFASNDFNTKTSFTTPNNSFEIGMFSLKLSHNTGKFTTTADIGIGNRAEQFNYNEHNTSFLLKQLFIDYAATDKLTLTAGSWTTHIGYELLDAADNDLYSMSYAFSYGPFFHTGIKANYAINKFNFMAGVANPTDLKSSFQKVNVYDTNNNLIGTKSYANKFFIWQLGYTGEQLSAYLNGQHGSYNPSSSNVSQFDLTAAYKLTDHFKLGINATHVTITADEKTVEKQKWSSLVGYLKYDVTNTLALNYRAEYLNNKENALALGATNGNTVFANTISATIKTGAFQLKPELRLESASENIYHDKNNNPTGNAANVLIAAIYKF